MQRGDLPRDAVFDQTPDVGHLARVDQRPDDFPIGGVPPDEKNFTPGHGESGWPEPPAFRIIRRSGGVETSGQGVTVLLCERLLKPLQVVQQPAIAWPRAGALARRHLFQGDPKRPRSKRLWRKQKPAGRRPDQSSHRRKVPAWGLPTLCANPATRWPRWLRPGTGPETGSIRFSLSCRWPRCRRA